MGQSIGSAADTPLGTVTAGGGGKAALVSSHLVSIGYGEREGQAARAQDVRAPLGTVVASKKHAVVAAHLMHVTHHGERAGSTPNDPLPTITAAHRGEQALVSANLIDLGHGESTKAGAKRWSHGTRSMEVPLNTVTASGCPSAMVAAFFEQANGGFYQGEGRPALAPMSTITASGTNQQLASAYLVKYYSQGGQTQGAADPMHTLPTKARMGLIQVKVHAGCLDDEQRGKAKLCAELLHKYLPEHFPEPAELVLMFHGGSWWALVDISLRMLVARELFRAQSFRDSYIITEIPNPAKLFKNGRQVPGDPRLIERIPLSITDQVRMCGNSVPPAMSKALALANFRHELPARRAA
jgi:DNA (cytosine-5)-methyltransferase 1